MCESQSLLVAAGEIWVDAMILSVFGDESADQTKQRVFAVSGIIGSDSEWIITKKAWLDRTGGKVFHAAECEAEYADDPSKSKHQENLVLYKDLTKILANGPLAGISVALDLAAHRDLLGKTLDDVGYYHCLTHVLDLLTQLGKKFNAKIPDSDYPDDEPINLEFTFDSRIQSNGNAGNLYSAFINRSEFAQNIESPLASKISFDDRSNPRIQMADLLARETMKEMERRIYRENANPRLSYQALDEGGHFIFVYHDREFCKLWAEMQPEIEEREGMNQRDYFQWLSERGRVQNGRPHDNWSNRFEYFAWKERTGPKS